MFNVYEVLLAINVVRLWLLLQLCNVMFLMSNYLLIYFSSIN